MTTTTTTTQSYSIILSSFVLLLLVFAAKLLCVTLSLDEIAVDYFGLDGKEMNPKNDKLLN